MHWTMGGVERGVGLREPGGGMGGSAFIRIGSLMTTLLEFRKCWQPRGVTSPTIKFLKIYLFYLLYFNQFPPPQGRNASCHEMSESRRLVKLKDIFPFMLFSCELGHRRNSALPVEGVWHLVKVKGSSTGKRPMHSPSQTFAIHSYHAPSSFLA